jgi:hypothetical protein
MCLPATVIEERTAHIRALIGAARHLVAPDGEDGAPTFEGMRALLREIDCRVDALGKELKSNCEPGRAEAS